MRKITVEDNKIVVEVDGAKVRYSLEIVRKRIDSLLQDLEEWRAYERLLTQRAGDGARCPRCQGILNDDGYCVVCGYPFPPLA